MVHYRSAKTCLSILLTLNVLDVSAIAIRRPRESLWARQSGDEARRPLITTESSSSAIYIEPMPVVVDLPSDGVSMPIESTNFQTPTSTTPSSAVLVPSSNQIPIVTIPAETSTSIPSSSSTPLTSSFPETSSSISSALPSISSPTGPSLTATPKTIAPPASQPSASSPNALSTPIPLPSSTIISTTAHPAPPSETFTSLLSTSGPVQPGLPLPTGSTSSWLTTISMELDNGGIEIHSGNCKAWYTTEVTGLFYDCTYGGYTTSYPGREGRVPPPETTESVRSIWTEPESTIRITGLNTASRPGGYTVSGNTIVAPGLPSSMGNIQGASLTLADYSTPISGDYRDPQTQYQPSWLSRVTAIPSATLNPTNIAFPSSTSLPPVIHPIGSAVHSSSTDGQIGVLGLQSSSIEIPPITQDDRHTVTFDGQTLTVAAPQQGPSQSSTREIVHLGTITVTVEGEEHTLTGAEVVQSSSAVAGAAVSSTRPGPEPALTSSARRPYVVQQPAVSSSVATRVFTTTINNQPTAVTSSYLTQLTAPPVILLTTRTEAYVGSVGGKGTTVLATKVEGAPAIFTSKDTIVVLSAVLTQTVTRYIETDRVYTIAPVTTTISGTAVTFVTTSAIETSTIPAQPVTSSISRPAATLVTLISGSAVTLTNDPAAVPSASQAEFSNAAALGVKVDGVWSGSATVVAVVLGMVVVWA